MGIFGCSTKGLHFHLAERPVNNCILISPWEMMCFVGRTSDSYRSTCTAYVGGLERDLRYSGVPSRSYDPGVQSVRTGIEGGEASALGSGE